MKLASKKTFFYIFFILNTVEEIRPSMPIIKQYPKTTCGLGLVGLTGLYTLVSSLHAYYLEKKYAFLHLQCTHNPKNTEKDFVVFSKQYKKYPDQHHSKKYGMFLNCMKDKEQNLHNHNKCTKAVGTMTEKPKKVDVPLHIQKYIK